MIPDYIIILKTAVSLCSYSLPAFQYLSKKAPTFWHTLHSVFAACFLPRDPGPCEAEMVRYHYNDDPNVKDCVGFIFGGCNGNANNFKTAEECVSQCRDRIGLKTTSKAITKETKVVKRIPGCNSTFGCCDDYITPASGPNQAGCPGISNVIFKLNNAFGNREYVTKLCIFTTIFFVFFQRINQFVNILLQRDTARQKLHVSITTHA